MVGPQMFSTYHQSDEVINLDASCPDNPKRAGEGKGSVGSALGGAPLEELLVLRIMTMKVISILHFARTEGYRTRRRDAGWYLFDVFGATGVVRPVQGLFAQNTICRGRETRDSSKYTARCKLS